MHIAEANKERKIYKVLALDISTNSVAYCLNTGDGIKTYGEIVFEGETVFERLADAQTKIREHEIISLEYDMILFESAVYIQNKRTVILLAYAYGAVLGVLTKPGIKVADVSPVVWQPYIGNPTLTRDEKKVIEEATPGKSKAWYSEKFRQTRKRKTMDWVEKKYGVVCDTDNIGDAIAISKFAIDNYATN